MHGTWPVRNLEATALACAQHGVEAFRAEVRVDPEPHRVQGRMVADPAVAEVHFQPLDHECDFRPEALRVHACLREHPALVLADAVDDAVDDEKEPSAPALAYRQKRYWKLKSEVLELLQEFISWELPAGMTKRTTAAYARWARDEPDRPSLDSVQKFGPLAKLLREARRPDSVEKAKIEEADALTAAPAEREARLHRKHVESERGQAMLALLREHGEMTRAKLEAELGWPQWSVGGYLEWLIAAGVVEKLGKNNRDARYRLR